MTLETGPAAETPLSDAESGRETAAKAATMPPVVASMPAKAQALVARAIQPGGMGETIAPKTH